MVVRGPRQHPDDETTAAALRARGFDVLKAPMLRFEPVDFRDNMDGRYGAVIVTSANALRGLASQLKGHHLLELPLFAVAEHTPAPARASGLPHPISSKRAAPSLRARVLSTLK